MWALARRFNNIIYPTCGPFPAIQSLNNWTCSGNSEFISHNFILIIPKFSSIFAFQLPFQVGIWLPHTLNNPFSVCIVECYKLPMEDKHTIFGARFLMGVSVVTIMLIFGVHLGQLPMEDLHNTNYCNYQLRNNNTVPHGRWAADCHQHSLSSSVHCIIWVTSRQTLSTHQPEWPLWPLGQGRWCAIMSCSNYLGRLPLVQQGYCWCVGPVHGPINSALDFYHTQSELVRRANSRTPYMQK